MTTLKAWILTVVAVILGFGGYLVATFTTARSLAIPMAHWVALIVVLALAFALLVAAIWVYRTRTRKAERAIKPMVAIRILLLGQSCAYVGAGYFTGWHAGVLVRIWLSGTVDSPSGRTAVAQILGGLVLIAVGYIVQALCKLPPDELEPNEPDDARHQGVEEGPERA